MTNLKKAQADPKAMERFIVERSGDQIESANFDTVFESMALQEKPKATRAASSKGGSDDYT